MCLKIINTNLKKNSSHIYIYKLKIPRLLPQPTVDNAFRHTNTTEYI